MEINGDRIIHSSKISCVSFDDFKEEVEKIFKLIK
jgi:hypothetical protein